MPSVRYLHPLFFEQDCADGTDLTLSTIITPLCGSHFCNLFMVVKIMKDVACNVSTGAPIFFSFRHSQLSVLLSSLLPPSVRCQQLPFFDRTARTVRSRSFLSTIITPLCGSHFCTLFMVVKIMKDVACNVSTGAPIFFSFRHSHLFTLHFSLFTFSSPCVTLCQVPS